MVAQEINPPLAETNADEYTRRTVRMWWAEFELLTTTPAEYMAGPRSLFEVSPLYGSPALPLIAWTLISIVSGALALAHTLRRPAGER